MAEKMGKYSITMPKDVAEAAKEFGGDAGFSSYVAHAVERQVRRDRLGELIAEYEELHGPISQERIDAAGARILEARARQQEQMRDRLTADVMGQEEEL